MHLLGSPNVSWCIIRLLELVISTQLMEVVSHTDSIRPKKYQTSAVMTSVSSASYDFIVDVSNIIVMYNKKRSGHTSVCFALTGFTGFFLAAYDPAPAPATFLLSLTFNFVFSESVEVCYSNNIRTEQPSISLHVGLRSSIGPIWSRSSLPSSRFFVANVNIWLLIAIASEHLLLG